ncbi:hypothetical protein B0T10DRAFT_464901 [Thelonectria olida]|uniref:Uncharacterized protein n=1 Tax=Thelonectria olida TaxID=1576542 RepID=A0A9P9AKI5_9HYPO|nr:hypothetical protein B0T10DRAFT_464901 [Thelonectria olida]
MLNLTGDRKASALVILCKPLRIHSSTVVDYWELQASLAPEKDDDQLSKSPAADAGPLTNNDAYFHPYLTDEGPVQEIEHLAQRSIHAEPLRFQPHDAAMNYAYDATARIFQSAGLLRDYVGSAIASEQEAEQWIYILLRIAAGIDWEHCIIASFDTSTGHTK